MNPTVLWPLLRPALGTGVIRLGVVTTAPFFVHCSKARSAGKDVWRNTPAAGRVTCPDRGAMLLVVVPRSSLVRAIRVGGSSSLTGKRGCPGRDAEGMLKTGLSVRRGAAIS